MSAALPRPKGRTAVSVPAKTDNYYVGVNSKNSASTNSDATAPRQSLAERRYNTRSAPPSISVDNCLGQVPGKFATSVPKYLRICRGEHHATLQRRQAPLDSKPYFISKTTYPDWTASREHSIICQKHTVSVPCQPIGFSRFVITLPRSADGGGQWLPMLHKPRRVWILPAPSPPSHELYHIFCVIWIVHGDRCSGCLCHPRPRATVTEPPIPTGSTTGAPDRERASGGLRRS